MKIKLEILRLVEEYTKLDSLLARSKMSCKIKALEIDLKKHCRHKNTISQWMYHVDRSDPHNGADVTEGLRECLTCGFVEESENGVFSTLIKPKYESTYKVAAFVKAPHRPLKDWLAYYKAVRL